MNDASESEQLVYEDIARVLVGRDEIARRVEALGREIAAHYADRELTIVAVLTGAIIFLADLVRCLPLRMHLDVISVSSYPGPATESSGPRLRLPISHDLTGRDVLVVDDILDSGRTLDAIRSEILDRAAASVRSCVLLDKARPELPARLGADYAGFAIPNEFVVGYGMDFNHLYRNLPDICTLKPSVLEAAS